MRVLKGEKAGQKGVDIDGKEDEKVNTPSFVWQRQWSVAMVTA